MKIVQINSVCGSGSTGRIAVDLCMAYEENGNECIVAYGRGNAPENVKTYRIGTELGVKIHGAFSRITDRQAFYSSIVTKKFIGWLEEYNPDVIHIHNLHGYYMDIRQLFAYIRKYNKKVIWTLHDCWTFTGHCSYFEYCGCKKYLTGCNHCPQKKDYPSSYLLDSSKKNYFEKKKLYGYGLNIHFVTPSNWLADLVKKSFLSAYPVTVIPNGVDQMTFFPVEEERLRKVANMYNISRKNKVILGVANIWNERKGIKYLLNVWKHSHENWQIVVVGLTRKQIQKIRKWEQTKVARGNLILIERTESADELAALYTIADVYVNPTLEDNYPTTNIEALSCGTPVVTFDTGGSSECIKKYMKSGNRGKDLSYGEIVCPKDSRKLMKAINHMITGNHKKIVKNENRLMYEKNNNYAAYFNLINDEE